MFAIHGLPKTPDTGERYQEGPGNPTTRQELHALFDVIGTPAWACIEGVQSPAWRSYLFKIRGKAPALYRWVEQGGWRAGQMLLLVWALSSMSSRLAWCRLVCSRMACDGWHVSSCVRCCLAQALHTHLPVLFNWCWHW